MKNPNSAYDTRQGSAITALLNALRENGRTVDDHVNGSVTVDGTDYTSEEFDRWAMSWDGTEDGLDD